MEQHSQSVRKHLRLWQILYQKGMIDPEFGVMDSGKAGEAGASGKCGLTFGQQWLSLVQFQTN